jgi:site-specific DNA-adenine methylase
MNKIKVPCSYQGGKQRLATQIVDILLKDKKDNTIFFDLCCGSGAISIELINRGIPPQNIVMLDISSWGTFWKSISEGNFDLRKFKSFLEQLPKNKEDYKSYFNEYILEPVKDEAEIYPILQANSFGGKQICRKSNHWCNASFRSYWIPTKTSIRKSPANPMQPEPKELLRRIELIVDRMKGITCISDDITSILDFNIPDEAIVYVDPPYQHTTGYFYQFNLNDFIHSFKLKFKVPLYISECIPLNNNSIQLNFGGSNGGITGLRKLKHEEWLSKF